MEKKKHPLIDRRTFVLGGIAAIGGTMFEGCSGARSEEPAPSAPPQPEEPAQETAPSPESEQEASAAAASNTLLVYFSRAGMNYTSGGPVHTDVGNTALVAGFIQELVDCDVYEIIAESPYPYEYEATCDQAMQEQNANARPAIAGELPDISGYDTLVVGCGVWWGDPPMIMHTFFESVDTAGKAVVPFVTYAVSSMGGLESDFKKMCPKAAVGDALAVRGVDAGAARADVEAWLRSLGLLT